MERIHILNYRKGMSFRRIVLVLLDSLCIALSGYGALLLRFNGPVPNQYLENLTMMLLPMIACCLVVFFYFKLYHSLWQFASIIELKNIVLATLADSIINVCLLELTGKNLPRSSYFIYFLLLTMFIGGSRFIYRLLRLKRSKIGFGYVKERKDLEKVMIIGAGLAGEKVYREIINSQEVYKQVMCFIDDGWYFFDIVPGHMPKVAKYLSWIWENR